MCMRNRISLLLLKEIRFSQHLLKVLLFLFMLFRHSVLMKKDKKASKFQ